MQEEGILCNNSLEIDWLKGGLQKEAGPPGNQQADWKSAVHLDSEKGQKHPKLYEFAFIQHSQLIEMIF